MWACLFGDRAIRNISTDQLKKNQEALKVALLAYKKEHGIWPHPGTLVGQVLKVKKCVLKIESVRVMHS